MSPTPTSRLFWVGRRSSSCTPSPRTTDRGRFVVTEIGATLNDVLIKALSGDMSAVPGAVVDSFAAGLSGDLLAPEHPEFAESTLIWNAMIQKRPALVVRPSTTSDVARTVDFARQQGLELSIKGGGHNIAGLALSDGGITLDMSRVNTVEVDVLRGIARVGPGCKLGDVDRATQQHGLATTLGFVSETGV